MKTMNTTQIANFLFQDCIAHKLAEKGFLERTESLEFINVFKSFTREKALKLIETELYNELLNCEIPARKSEIDHYKKMLKNKRTQSILIQKVDELLEEQMCWANNVGGFIFNTGAFGVQKIEF